MAEGFAKKYGSNIFDVYSAGTHPATKVSENAVLVMKEKDIDIIGQYPKSIKEIPEKLDIVITMGCGVECPFLFSDYREDWDLDDPVGKPIEVFREIRDRIEKKVKTLAESTKKYKNKKEYINYLKDKAKDSE